jgi:predicted AAA+ superfamily ATPase
MRRPKILKQRDCYIERIRPFMRKSIVKVMTGQRRVGKSYILFQLMDIIRNEDINANIIYINKEDMAFSDIHTAEELNDYVISKSKEDQMNYIFIDEIQEIKDFRLAIRTLALNEDNDIYVTGSNSEVFSVDLANMLGGRYVEFNIYSLSYLEFLDFMSLTNDDDSLEKYVHFGGLPYLIHLPLEEDVVMEYNSSIYSTVILKDVVNRKKIRNTAFLEQLVTFLAGNTGNLFSAKSISDYLKSQHVDITSAAVSDYAQALSDAFIVHKVGRYDIAGKKIFERGDKYYFENLGIRNAIAGYKPQDRAMRLENLVFNHLVYCGYDVKVGVMGAYEIDFVCRRRGELLYVQVAADLASDSTIKREFGNLLAIKDNYPKVVVSADKTFENTYEGVEHIYIRDFLSSTLSHSIVK